VVVHLVLLLACHTASAACLLAAACLLVVACLPVVAAALAHPLVVACLVPHLEQDSLDSHRLPEDTQHKLQDMLLQDMLLQDMLLQQRQQHSMLHTQHMLGLPRLLLHTWHADCHKPHMQNSPLQQSAIGCSSSPALQWLTSLDLPLHREFVPNTLLKGCGNLSSSHVQEHFFERLHLHLLADCLPARRYHCP